mmetsp:Transcript_29419/g.62620  ORF Transcript_29419/g.62620 Transcript_29419/m.62620 type:complete len:221 (+) Transcript_29419:34-696(+)
MRPTRWPSRPQKKQVFACAIVASHGGHRVLRCRNCQILGTSAPSFVASRSGHRGRLGCWGLRHGRSFLRLGGSFLRLRLGRGLLPSAQGLEGGQRALCEGRQLLPPSGETLLCVLRLTDGRPQRLLCRLLLALKSRALLLRRPKCLAAASPRRLGCLHRALGCLHLGHLRRQVRSVSLQLRGPSSGMLQEPLPNLGERKDIEGPALPTRTRGHHWESLDH